MREEDAPFGEVRFVTGSKEASEVRRNPARGVDRPLAEGVSLAHGRGTTFRAWGRSLVASIGWFAKLCVCSRHESREHPGREHPFLYMGRNFLSSMIAEKATKVTSRRVEACALVEA